MASDVVLNISLYMNTHQIAGKVMNRLGQPVPFAPVKLMRSGGNTYTKPADLNGDFLFDQIAAGQYRMSARLTGYRFTPIYVNVSDANVSVSIKCEMSLWDQTIAPAYYSDKTPPGIPGGFSVVALSPTQIELSWSVPQDNVSVSGFRIFDGGGSHIASAVTDYYRFSGLSSGIEYCYSVSAFDGVGNESAKSAQTCATTP